MKGNKHYQDAVEMADRFRNGSQNPAELQAVGFQAAQFEATLALVEEQRTANLVALIPSIIDQDRLEEVVFQVLDRLGMDREVGSSDG